MEASEFTIDKISTMSLGEFKNLLNNTLTVPNGTSESQASSDSPRSQTSTDVSRTSTTPRQTKSTPTKSAYSYRSVSATRSTPVKSASKPAVPSKPKVSDVGNSVGSRAVTSSQTLTNGSSGSRPLSRNVSNTSVRSVASSNYGQDRPKTPSGLTKSRSNASSISDNSYSVQSNPKTAYTSRSSSHSSLQSYESTDDGRNSLGADLGGNVNSKPVLSPSSVDSDYSFRGSSGTSSEYARSNSYTPCSLADDKYRLDHLRPGEVRASSEPRDVQSSHVVEKPLNVGYATFSYTNDTDAKDGNELDEIENEIQMSREALNDSVSTAKDKSSDSKTSNMRPQTPSGRATPSLIPRPITPKVSRKLSLPQNESDSISDDRSRSARPPTPRKSNILARAHGSGVRSADKSKEQTYREIFQKRSTTPGPGSVPSSGSSAAAGVRRSMTPGPYLHKSSTLKATSATTNRSRLNEAMDLNKTAPLPVSSDNRDTRNISSDKKRTMIIDRKTLAKQKSVDQGETVIMVNVDRSDNKHSLSVQSENDKRPQTTNTNTNKSKVLARARTEDNRSRGQSRTLPSTPRKRPQSVEPRQLVPGQNKSLSVKRDVNGEPGVYDRTQEWVQTAVEQTKVQKPKPNKTYTPKMRRAMTPNSFDMRIDMEKEEPRSLDEIKAALTLPFDGLDKINPDELEAPPEDAEMYATMEQLFHELRQQELKNSVNETPGSSTASKGFKTRSRSSKSNSSTNDDAMSLDSNKNVKRSEYSFSGRSSSNVTSPAVVKRSNKVNAQTVSNSKSNSRTSSVSSTGHSQTFNQRSSLKDNQFSRSNSNASKASSSSTTASTRTSFVGRPSSPSPALSAKRPASPRTISQPPRPASPRVTSQPPRPASPRVTSQPPRPASPRVSPHTSRPASPRTTVSSSSYSSNSVRQQPPRPASTPPRPSTPVKRQSSKSSEDNDVFEKETKTDSSGLIHKIKEMIKVKPRKDKADGVKLKTRIPAPKSLKDVGRSRSFSNLSSLANSVPTSPTDKDCTVNGENEMNGYSDHINGGLNVTLSGRSETPGPGPKWATPLTTGRSSLIRKESMEKNKNATNRLVRAVSVERNMSGLTNSYSFCEDGEYV